jgi:phage shock protein A
MALLERVSTLLRANLNDLIDKAEDPQKLLRQLVLDMENQLMQVKTQVAIAIADQHLLEKKRKEHMDSAAEWRSKAELAVKKGHDDLARAALERSLSQDQIAKGFSQQLEDQHAEADTLRTALRKLDQKLVETRSRCELLIAQDRRTRMVSRATEARQIIGKQQNSVSLDRMKSRIVGREARNEAEVELLGGDSLEDRFAALDREEHIERLLRDLKAKQEKPA